MQKYKEKAIHLVSIDDKESTILFYSSVLFWLGGPIHPLFSSRKNRNSRCRGDVQNRKVLPPKSDVTEPERRLRCGPHHQPLHQRPMDVGQAHRPSNSKRLNPQCLHRRLGRPWGLLVGQHTRFPHIRPHYAAEFLLHLQFYGFDR